MAFKDIFDEQRKKLQNYFGVGQPGLGTFGQQASNVLKPIVNKNIQNYQKAGRYLQPQNVVKRNVQNYQQVARPVQQFAQRQIQRPIIQANLRPIQTLKRGYQSQPRMEEMPAIQAMHGVNPYLQLQREDKLYNKITNWRPQNKVLNVASNFLLGSPEENQKKKEAFRAINIKSETPEQRKLAQSGSADQILWGIGGGTKSVNTIDQAAKTIAKSKSAVIIGDVLKKTLGIESNKVGKSLIKDLISESDPKKVKNIVNLLKPASQKAQTIIPKATDALSNEARKLEAELKPLQDKIQKAKTKDTGSMGSFTSLGDFDYVTPAEREKIVAINDRLTEIDRQIRGDATTRIAIKKELKAKGISFDPDEPMTTLQSKLNTNQSPEITKLQAEYKDYVNRLASDVKPLSFDNYMKATRPNYYKQLTGTLSPQSTQGATTKVTPKATNIPLTPKNATEGVVQPPVKQTEGKPQLNTSKFNISEAGKKNLDETVASIKPELEQVKGKVLKNEDVVDAAKASKILSREVNPEATKKATAAVTRLRQEVAAGAEGKGLTKDFIENLKVLKSYSADAGRKLQAFNIKASPETSIKESVIADLVNLGKKSDDLIKAAKGVDFDNPKQVSKFYRQFVKPSFGEVLDEYRYINLLSSPQTHIVNAFSNLLQGTVLNPATKLYSGVVDTIGSALTGKQRTSYMREVPAYSKGFINSMGDAFKEAAEVMKGNKFVERPDINRLSTGKLGPGEYVMRALEAGDVFFRKMIKGGEMESLAYKASRSGKNIPKSVMEKQAADAAEYFVFRKAPDPTNKTGQGAVLSGIDKATEAVYKFRNAPGVKWVIPFVQTPMNILKQGLEYSPLGVSTLAGNTNKTQQLAKALIGSTVLAGAATLDSTWDAPTSKNEKEEFYASGRKPYSVKIGNNWVSYSRLGPLAYPMAMSAAVKWYFENDPKATSTDSIDKTTKLLGGIAGFFSDQSYLSGIGDLVSVAKGEDYAIKGMIANFGKQLVPLTSLQGWVARQLDPIYRQPKTVTEQIKSGIPGLSKSMGAYTDPLGNPSKRENLPFNAWSPVNVNPANQQFEDIYQNRQLQKRSDAEAKALTSGTKQLPDGRVAMIINNEVKKFDNQQEADEYTKGIEFVKSNKNTQVVGDLVYKKADTDKGFTTQPKIDYDADLMEAKKTSLEKNKNYKGWLENADKLYNNYQQQLQDPSLDELEILKIQNKIDTLVSNYQKFKGYGGFTKGKKAKKFSLSGISTGIKIPIRTAKKPTFKNISATPKIAIKTTKPKLISKATLAKI